MERDLYHPDRDSLDTFAYQIVTALKSDLSRAVESYGSSRSASDGDSDSEEDDNDIDSQTGSNCNSEDDDRPKANRQSTGPKPDAEGVELTRKEHEKKVKGTPRACALIRYTRAVKPRPPLYQVHFISLPVVVMNIPGSCQFRT